MIKVVIDRIVDEKHAVLLTKDEEQEIIVPIDKLPSGAMEGTWLKVSFHGDDIEKIIIDQESKATQERISSKMALLRKKKGSQFKKK
ncbi:DUF3006 domain-containing protein [Bacillus shivajii]|uniref:DUF3006 domain-containing protein n=1 Tax=Bacillus shivajii TaxID=1983719 RepID=UPI001CFB8E27|nr:DUF3006 domain-containing protein [Bacillus shivajii]UCZ53939.1 DUF3006 domain-containing protein [Bacillus shivajii]